MKQPNFFTNEELRCKCGCGVNGVKPEALLLLNALRILVQRPLVLSSAYRCYNHPEELKKQARTGQHPQGHAFDIRHYGDQDFIDQIKRHAENLGFNGIGISRSFIHIDLRPNRARWTY